MNVVQICQKILRQGSSRGFSDIDIHEQRREEVLRRLRVVQRQVAEPYGQRRFSNQ